MDRRFATRNPNNYLDQNLTVQVDILRCANNALYVGSTTNYILEKALRLLRACLAGPHLPHKGVGGSLNI